MPVRRGRRIGKHERARLRAARRAMLNQGKETEVAGKRQRRRRHRGGARTLSRSVERAMPRKLTAAIVQWTRDEMTKNVIRAEIIGQASSRQHTRGLKFSAWLDAEFAEKRAEREKVRAKKRKAVDKEHKRRHLPVGKGSR